MNTTSQSFRSSSFTTWATTVIFTRGKLLYEVVNTHTLTHEAEPFLRSFQLCSYSRTSQQFIELEVSMQCSQEPSTGPYPEPDQSNPFHPISLRSILILFTHLLVGLPRCFFPSGLIQKKREKCLNKFVAFFIINILYYVNFLITSVL
jgi:hypothetical protein